MALFFRRSELGNYLRGKVYCLNRHSILGDQYQKIRQQTLRLMEPLSIEDYLARSSFEASPPKWHLGHTTWFFETFILKNQLNQYQVFDPKFGYYFNSYYESLGDRLAREERSSLTRPALALIHDYRKYVDAAMMDLLAKEGLKEEVLDFIELGLNHEQQHQELFLTDFKKALGQQAHAPVYDPQFPEDEVLEGPQKWIELPEGLYEIGHSGAGFHFDNEAPRHKVFLPAFAISNQLITNEEWLEFMEAGGYENPQWWHSDGWAWRQKENIEAPLYWSKQEGRWQNFTLAGMQELKREAPVKHISYYEAWAFAQWKGQRLPTEAEWEAAQEFLDWGARWEWTESAYLPYPGYKPYIGPAKEYNGKFMVNQMVLRGASVVTPTGHARPSYRNFFHPHFRWQFTGLRLAKK